MCTCICTRTHTHTPTHTQTCTHTHAHTNTRTNTHTCTHTQTMRTHTHTHKSHTHTIKALVDIAASEGWLATTLRVTTLVQMCVQGSWSSSSSLLTLPHLETDHIAKLNAALKQHLGAKTCGVEEIYCLAELAAVCECCGLAFLKLALGKSLSGQQLSQVNCVGGIWVCAHVGYTITSYAD